MSGKNIEKPFGLLKREFKDNLVKLINESDLPLSVTDYILKAVSAQVSQTVVQQENQEIAEYQAHLEEAEKAEE